MLKFNLFIIFVLLCGLATASIIDEGTDYSPSKSNVTYIVNQSLTGIYTHLVNETCLVINDTEFCNQSATHIEIPIYVPDNFDPTITYIEPATNYTQDQDYIRSNVNVSDTEGLHNVTHYLYNSSKALIYNFSENVTGTKNQSQHNFTSLNYSTYYLNATVCDSSGLCVNSVTWKLTLEEEVEAPGGGGGYRVHCDIDVYPESITFTSPNQTAVLMITNNEQVVNFPTDYGINSRIGLPSIKNRLVAEIPTVQPNRTSAGKINFTGAEEGYAKIVLWNSRCQDIIIPIKAEFDNQSIQPEYIQDIHPPNVLKAMGLWMLESFYNILDKISVMGILFTILVLSIIIAYNLTGFAEKDIPLRTTMIVLFTFLSFGTLMYWINQVAYVPLPEMVEETLSPLVIFLDDFLIWAFASVKAYIPVIKSKMLFLSMVGFSGAYPLSGHKEYGARIGYVLLYTFMIISTLFYLFSVF